MNLVQDYPTTQTTPQSALQALLQPPTPVRARLDALDQARARRSAKLRQAAELRHEARCRLARQHLINGDVDLARYREEVAASDAALDTEQRDVPPPVIRGDLEDRALAVAAEATARFYDQAIVALEQQAAAWTPATVEQAEGGSDDE
jgi:hypothetical protein